jgi:membrane-bound ClpP family serine protease
MFEFLNELDPTLKMFWYLALPTSLIFIVQLIMTFFGADASDGMDADFDGDLDGSGPFQLLSFRNLINFLLGFAWGGISFSNIIQSRSTLVFVAFLIGLAFFFMFVLIMQQLLRFQEDNTTKIQDALNQTGSVYLTIPEQKNGFGKIQVSIKGSQKEYQAVTNGERIPSGHAIRIVEVIDGNVCVVEKL